MAEIVGENSTMRPTLHSVQALRAIAAAAVVCYHVLYMLAHSAGYAFEPSGLGAAGVDLFFVISGFVMVYTNYTSFQAPGAPQSFLRRRILRIVPIYWLYTTLVALLLAFAPGLFATTAFDWRHVVSSYLFLLSPNSAGQIGTVLQTGWTLCYEMYFYALFALLLALPRRFFLIVCATLFLIGISVGQFVALPVWASVVSNVMLLEFLLGAALAFAYQRGCLLNVPAACAPIAAALAFFWMTRELDWGIWARLLRIGLPSVALLWGALSLERAQWRTPNLLVQLGDSSYSLYLVHPFVVAAFGKLWAKLALAASVPVAIPFALALVAALAAGHLAWWWIERPLARRLSGGSGARR